jgi:hypothetical protein
LLSTGRHDGHDDDEATPDVSALSRLWSFSFSAVTITQEARDFSRAFAFLASMGSVD